jgi:outer membrane protein assembly factor BamB
MARAEDWNRWRGPNTDGISKETGWSANWPVEGPKHLWKASVGTGFSSMSVSAGRVYTMGNDGMANDTIYCFDAVTGAPVWKHSYPCILDPKYYEGGPSCTPTVEEGRVYTLSRQGDLFCLDAADGKVIWTKNVHKEFGAEIPMWGFAGSPLIEGDLVILDVGSAGMGLNKKTGELVWHSGTTPPGYSSPHIFMDKGERVVVLASLASAEAFKPVDGKTVWSYPWKTNPQINAADPIIFDNKMFITSGCGHGCALVDLSNDQPTTIWENKNMRSHITSPVLWQGYIYGVDDVSGSLIELKCLDAKTGEIKWEEPTFGKGAVMIADGKIIGLSDKGELMVAEATPAAFKPISRAQVLGGKCWTVPVLANGRIYCRNAKGDLLCVDVSKDAGKL